MDVEIVQTSGLCRASFPMTGRRRRCVLVRQYRHAIGRSAWELPAGTRWPNEEPTEGWPPVSATRRSAGPVERLEPLGAFFPTPGYCDEEMNFYKATGLREPGAG